MPIITNTTERITNGIWNEKAKADPAPKNIKFRPKNVSPFNKDTLFDVSYVRLYLIFY